MSTVVAFAAVNGCGDGSDPAPSRPAEIPRGLTDEVPRAVSDACEEAMVEFDRFPVYCPPVVPVGKTEVDFAGRYVPHTYAMSFRTDSVRPEPHWVVSGGAARELRRSLANRYDEPALVDRLTIAGVSVEVYELHYYDLHGGHVLVAWEHDGAGYLASVHGFEHRKLAEGIAEGLIREMSGVG